MTDKLLKPKKAGVRERLKQENKDKIVMAARQLFAESGYDAATLRQIASHAGLGLGTLFNYINDKRDLIYLIFNEEVDSLTDRALAAPRPWQPFVAKIISVTEPHYRLFGSEPDLARILLSEILLHTPGFHLERYLSIRGRLIRGVEGLVAEAQQAGELRDTESAEIVARSIFFLFSAALRWWLATPNPEWRAGSREFERVLKLHVAGLAPGSPSGGSKSAAIGKGARSTKRGARSTSKKPH
jgi:AcrR family transcriptional regulator